MESNRIIIHQAFYGEVNRAHSCIQQTLVDIDVTSFLTSFTDRPASLPTGVDLLPYLSGSPFSNKYYFFTKTFSDSTASRAGMVFSHVLILNISDLEKVNNLNEVFRHFITEIPKESLVLKPLDIDLINSGQSEIERIKQPTYIRQIISAYIAGKKPILFSSNIDSFTKGLQVIWNSPEIELRKSIKFRISFTPSDIQNTNDITIVSIQENLLEKWQGQDIIKDSIDSIIEITEPSELLFLGVKEENAFYVFLVSLNIDLKQIRNFQRYGDLFNDYLKIDTLENADQIRQDIRLLSQISPSSNYGVLIKNKFIDRLTYLIESKKDSNIKALKNIEWSAFQDGLKKSKQIITQFIDSEISQFKNENIKSLSEIIQITVTDSPKNWWHNSVEEVVNLKFNSAEDVALKSFWSLFESSTNTLKNLFFIIRPTNSTESILLKYFPQKIDESICEELMLIAQRNNWFLLNANLLANNYSFEDALNKQLVFEKKLGLNDSVGVKFIVSKLSSKQLVDIAIKSSDNKLVSLSIDAIVSDSNLFGTFEPANHIWYEIWQGVVLKTNNLFTGLIGKEEETAFTVLDRLVTNQNVDSKIVELIAKSKYSNISNYNNRCLIWSKLPINLKNTFLTSTTKNIVNRLIEGKIDSKYIETEIINVIVSDSFMTTFLNDNRNDIEAVLKIYEIFDGLRDDFLSDYIKYYQSNISENQSQRLGKLTLNRQFKITARSISEKAKYQNSFKPAYNECKGLIEVNFFESLFDLWFSKTDNKPNMKNQLETNFKQLPTIVILTAIKEEYQAVREHLINIVDADQNDTVYEAGVFKYKDREIAKVIIRECGPKNTTASQETERAIQYFMPNAMFFVGIAGSRKPNDFSVGDVIFPDKVYSYEGGKSEKDSFVSRPDLGLLTFTLIEKAKKERHKKEWKELIKGAWNTENIKADLGVIASGEQVVEHYNSNIGNVLKEHYNDTSAVEMEGFGFAKATNKQGRETRNMEVGIVRGISDIIEQPNGKKKKYPDNRPIDAKKFASATASAFAFWLILKTYS